MRKYLRGHDDSVAPTAYTDYLLCSKIWHCRPSQLLEESLEDYDLYLSIYAEEIRAKRIADKRAEQDVKTAS